MFTEDEAVKVADRLGYPVLVRPSYVLGGQGMEIAYSEQDIREYMQVITRHKVENPVLVDKYMMGREIEVDAICDGEDILIPGIMEHFERAGVHSGDSISMYPSCTFPPSTRTPSSGTPARCPRASRSWALSISSLSCITTRSTSLRSTRARPVPSLISPRSRACR